MAPIQCRKHTVHGDHLVVVYRRLRKASLLQAGLALEKECDGFQPQYCRRVLCEALDVRDCDMLACNCRHSPVT